MIGETLGSWRITGRIGAGGMGEVWSAEHEKIGQSAAIKVLLPETSRNPEAVERFFNEARAASMVRHPGLIRIYDFGRDERGAYIVMEKLDGESLRQRIDRVGRLAPDDATAIAWQVASGLEATHAAGVVHRDLKPDNLFLVVQRRDRWALQRPVASRSLGPAERLLSRRPRKEHPQRDPRFGS